MKQFVETMTYWLVSKYAETVPQTEPVKEEVEIVEVSM